MRLVVLAFFLFVAYALYCEHLLWSSPTDLFGITEEEAVSLAENVMPSWWQEEQQAPKRKKEPPPFDNPSRNSWFVELRGSAYRPNEKLFRKVYNEVLVNGGLLIAYSFVKRWSVVGSAEYMERSGRSAGLRDRTRLQLIPISLLIRYKYFMRPCYDLYFGIGPRLFIMREHNNVGVLETHVTEHVFGGVAETGVLLHIGRLDFDFFIAYSYGKKRISISKTNISGNSPDLGGLQAGLGIGVNF